MVEKDGASESRGWPKCDDHLGPKEEFSLYFSLCLINTEKTKHPSTQVAGIYADQDQLLSLEMKHLSTWSQMKT